ncbi:MAG TPA: alpha/beta fold hydrolase [Acidimicrobiales bacterium]|nr:alpha/beta fold hydrolase [Acidimicrobiales bacterium]
MARLVLVHGFTQTGASWSPVRTLLEAGGHTVEAPDAPGHGTRAGTPMDLWRGADVLAGDVQRATWVGYSMGGRLALHVALAHPEVVERLVLVGSSPGIATAAERAARRAADAELAGHLLDVGVSAFLDEWLAQPLFASLPSDAADRASRLTNTAEGLAASLRLAGTGAQDSLWDRLDQIDVPTLLVVGGDDAKFRNLAFAMAAGLPDATIFELGGCGHACHLEAPERFADAVLEFVEAN